MSSPTVISLGCRLNAFESEVMRSYAATAGLGEAVIVNTCAVTGEAVRQAAQTIRRLKRENPRARIIVTGCAAQIEPQRFCDMAEVDHVVGNAEKMRPQTFAALAVGTGARVAIDDIQTLRTTAQHVVGSAWTQVRAAVEVQNGCDHRCTFCVIPFGRGPSRSVPAGEVVTRVRQLVEAGCKEAVLTGVDLTAYGADLPGGMTLGRLARQVLRFVPELERLRLSSIDQVEADEQLIQALAEEPRLMPHLHLSLQSGDDLILKRMKRRHSRAEAVAFCERVRRLRPDIVLGADIIAGFPTETEAQLANSLSIVDDCGLTWLHVFPYSPRAGTPAARMPQVPRAEVKDRAARLRAKASEVERDWLARQHGAEVPVLIEWDRIGRTPQFAETVVSGLPAGSSKGQTVRARITGHGGRRLEAEAVA